MPVTAVQLREPQGPVAPSFFPGESAADLDVRLVAYITDGEAQVDAFAAASGLTVGTEDRDAAVRNWALYRAYDAVANRLATSPLSVGLSDQGDRRYDKEQISILRRRAEEYRITFSSNLDRLRELNMRYVPITTRSTPTRYEW